MNARDIHEFVRRDRTAVEASRHAYWAGLFQRDGCQPLWNAAQALFAHARARSGPIFQGIASATPISLTISSSWRDSSAPRMRSPVADLLADAATTLQAAGVSWSFLTSQVDPVDRTRGIYLT